MTAWMDLVAKMWKENKGTKNTRTHDKGQTPDQRAQPRTKETEQVQSTKPKSS